MGRLGVLILAGAVLAAGAMDDEAARRILEQAHAADQPCRNAVYLYLRLAGVVWVVVEWVAAVMVWRTYRLLRAAARERGLAP
jgi:hypothetical protein